MATTSRGRIWPFFMAPLACAVGTAAAADFQLAGVDVQLQSAISIGSSLSTRDPDADLMRSASGDDGRRNYQSGDWFSKTLKGVHDLELRRGESGAFVRGSYWYDYALRDEGQRFKDVEDAGRQRNAKSAGAQILDAFVYHNYQIADQPGSARLGRQVVSWGESTFIQGGLNTINPASLTALRRPGSEIKESLIPVNMVYAIQNLTDNVSADFFYQLDWEQTSLDNCGTFFSSNDYVADGCSDFDSGPVLTGNAAAVAGLTPFGVALNDEGVRIRRAGEENARNGGQWGMSLRWFVPSLDTEFGAYIANYHSRLPYVGTVSSPYFSNTGFAPQLCGNLGLPGGACAGFLGSDAGRSLAGALRLGTSGYLLQYPEDIRMYGLSFSTILSSGTALQGELSYRPNMPLQFNGVDLIQASLNDPSRSPLLTSGALASGDSARSNGYRRKEVTQLQVTATHAFSQIWGADQVFLIGEAGATYVGGLEGRFGPRYGRSSTFGSGELADNQVCLANSETPQHCNDDGFVTRFSWGYRARMVLSYADAFAGVDLKPSFSWSHDVKGYGPNEGSGFNEGSKAISLGLDAALRDYNASLSYTDFIDGTYGTRGDRDFLALSVGITF
ncbi:DUF1302 domain-containing protein [Stutzerimonas sp. VN223-3]|uniref:DUF1302 domain-containing protein n=1 Tax=Stutzerimonas sp. VN223-3 TaxID=3384601 RepID=UPI0038B57D86